MGNKYIHVCRHTYVHTWRSHKTLREIFPSLSCQYTCTKLHAQGVYFIKTLRLDSRLCPYCHCLHHFNEKKGMETSMKLLGYFEMCIMESFCHNQRGNTELLQLWQGIPSKVNDCGERVICTCDIIAVACCWQFVLIQKIAGLKPKGLLLRRYIDWGTDSASFCNLHVCEKSHGLSTVVKTCSPS